MLKTYLGISIGVSAVMLLLLALRPYICRHYSAKCRYVIWIVTAVILITPLKFNFTHQVQLIMPVLTEYKAPEKIQTDYDTMVRKADIPVHRTQPLNIWRIINTLWLAGAVLFMLYYFSGYALLCRKIKRRCTDINRHGGIRVMRCEGIKTPMLIGFFRPKILLPQNFKDDTNSALKHELIHCRRGDLWINLLFVTANAIHWFNPAVYIMRYIAKMDMEYSCDEAVIKECTEEYKKAYSRSILQCASDTGFLSASFNGNKNSLKKRILNILSPHRKRNGTPIISAVLICFVLCTGLIGCTEMTDVTPASSPNDYNTSLIWFDENNTDPDTVKIPCETVSILYDGAEQLDAPKKCTVWLNERLGLFHTCITADAKNGNHITVQPWGIPDTPEEVPYSDIVRNENGYYGQFIYWVTEMASEPKTQTYEPFYAQVTLKDNGSVILRSDDNRYIVKLNIIK